MKNKKTLYCDIEFINALDDREKLDFISLCDESYIFVNISILELKQKAFGNNTIKMLMKKDEDGQCKIKYKKFAFNSIQKNEDVYRCYCPIILIKQTQEERRENNLCFQYNNRYGIACYDQTSFKEIEELTDDNGFAIKKGEQDSWRNRLKNIRLQGNAMVIIDPYLIADTRTYEKNIYEILDVLLPNETSIEYNLTIITYDAKEDWDARYKNISSFITKQKPKLSISFNILKDVGPQDAVKYFHDRIILTNYYVITCGAGFNLFKKDGSAKQTTTISLLYPFIQKYIKWATDNYVNQLETANILLQSSEQFLGVHNGNRLFLLKREDKQ